MPSYRQNKLARLLHRARANADRIKWDTLARYLAYRDPRTPRRAKLAIALTVGYALSPIDLIPDFIPILGYLDDLLIVPLGIAYSTKLVPREVMEECRARAKVEFSRGSPKSRRAAVIIVLIWALLLALFAFFVLKLFRSSRSCGPANRTLGSHLQIQVVRCSHFNG